MSIYSINADTEPVIRTGWSIKKHNRPGIVSVDFSRPGESIRLLRCPLDKKLYLKQKLNGQVPCNATLLDFLLEHAGDVPIDFFQSDVSDEFPWIYFPGTEYIDMEGSLCVRSLCRNTKGWVEGSAKLERLFRLETIVAVLPCR
jgi:hypothetical protein